MPCHEAMNKLLVSFGNSRPVSLTAVSPRNLVPTNYEVSSQIISLWVSVHSWVFYPRVSLLGEVELSTYRDLHSTQTTVEDVYIEETPPFGCCLEKERRCPFNSKS